MRTIIATAFLSMLPTLCLAGLEYRDAIVKVTVPLDGGVVASMSAVCVTEDGLFVSAGHGGFKRGQTYKAHYDNGDARTYQLKCLSVRMLKETDGEGVVVLKAVSEKPDTYIPIGTTPRPWDSVYAIGYQFGRFTYGEGRVVATNRGGREIICDFILMEGASGGALVSPDGKMIGIQSARGDWQRSPESYFIGCEVFAPCVQPFLRAE